LSVATKEIDISDKNSLVKMSTEENKTCKATVYKTVIIKKRNVSLDVAIIALVDK